MESPIIMLDERTDQATRKMLQKVVERKQKYDQLHYRHLVLMWSSIFISLATFSICITAFLHLIRIHLLPCFQLCESFIPFIYADCVIGLLE